MATHYLHHRIRCAPRAWDAVARQIATRGRQSIVDGGGELYGVWRSQIGTPRDELNAISVWTESAAAAAAKLLERVDGVVEHASLAMVPTLRPLAPEPPRRQGNYAFRWFVTPEQHWAEFLALCTEAWPDFEAAYDSQVIGLWRVLDGRADTVRSLLLTRRPDLAMWERSKLPANAVEAQMRAKLSRRYDLCDDTHVYTTTLFTAEDRQDTARWT